MLDLMDYCNNHFVINNEETDVTITGSTIVGLENTYYAGLYIIIDYVFGRRLVSIVNSSAGVVTLAEPLEEFEGVIKVIQSAPRDGFKDLSAAMDLDIANGLDLVVKESQDTTSVTYDQRGKKFENKYRVALNAYQKLYSDLLVLRF